MRMEAVSQIAGNAPVSGRGQPAALRWSLRLLVATIWISGAIFGAYILAFFGGTALRGTAERWNESLPMLHDAAAPLATFSMGLHFAAGGLLLLFGPIQFIASIRTALPAFHRWLGRAYILCAGLAGLGGLVYIAAKGTIGGPWMSVGFGLYGALTTLSAWMAYSHARAGRFEAHRAWTIRLFALTVGSWLYRVEYGFWFLAMGRLGHVSDFTGWFDMIMAYFFYVPNLLVAELIVRSRRTVLTAPAGTAAAGVLLVAAAFVLVATWAFTADYWGPGIVSGLTGAPL